MPRDLNRPHEGETCPDYFQDAMEFHNCDRVSIAFTRFPINISPDTHNHESYEFMLPATPMPHVLIGKKHLGYEAGNIYPVNPWVTHGASNAMPGINFTCLMVDRTFMNETTYFIAGKTDISFDSCVPPDKNFYYLVNSFVEEDVHRQTGFEFILQNLANLILVHLVRNSHNTILLPDQKEPAIGKSRLSSICDYLRENYNRTFSLDDLAREADLSPYYFIRAFKAQTGKTPYDYLLDIKIKRARELMDRDLSITEICFMCGFNNPSHFTATFKKRVGVSPSHYRKLINK